MAALHSIWLVFLGLLVLNTQSARAREEHDVYSLYRPNADEYRDDEGIYDSKRDSYTDVQRNLSKRWVLVPVIGFCMRILAI